jgi:5,10-methylene-tetrahydrofolate dehydrogenase/methenyl tetrahydrofolate cyclohydrolase
VTHPDNRILGAEILRVVRANYEPYREDITNAAKNLTIIRLQADPTDPYEWWQRMEAARISATQKVKTFTWLGLRTTALVLPADVSNTQFAAAVDRANADPDTTATIVQMPVPPRLRQMVQDIDPTKDIDGLLGDRSRYPVPATAEGIWRIVEPFARDQPAIAVVGSDGFVGRGVARLLAEHGHQPITLDIGADLRAVRDVDIVVSVTGNPRILGPDHIQPHHRLVVDSGFVPQRDGGVHGDVQAEAYPIPQQITPVPGGTGPVEMAILLERIVRKEVEPGLEPWSYEGRTYRLRQRTSSSRTDAIRAAFPGSVHDAVRQPPARNAEKPAQRRPPDVQRGPEQSR